MGFCGGCISVHLSLYDDMRGFLHFCRGGALRRDVGIGCLRLRLRLRRRLLSQFSLLNVVQQLQQNNPQNTPRTMVQANTTQIRF